MIPRLFFLFPLCFITCLSAQEILFQEDFNSCTLPATWQVKIDGYQNVKWYVGKSQNNHEQGASMDGSCFLFIDDDGTGNNTPPFVIDVITAPFDCSKNATVELSMDVHYRDWSAVAEYFQILLDDGTTQKVLKTYQGNAGTTGDSIHEYETFKFDLSLVTKSPNARLIFRYDDAGGFNWWAGVDNIRIVGEGEGVNVLAESFNDCVQPAGWESTIQTGNQPWSFGYAQQGGGSMNGSCFAYFDDDFLGDTAAYSNVRLATPWMDGTEFGQFELNFDMIHRYVSEVFTLIVEHGNGDEFILVAYSGDVGGPNFRDFVHKTFDLSPYRNKQMRVVFQYSDGNDWGWWCGIDNVKITGSGAANDLCANAVSLQTGAACIPGSNNNAVFDGPLPACAGRPSGGLWYSWQADFTGDARFSSHAQFNDLISVYTGTCASPQALVCENYDEHGFIGENARFAVQQGTTYLIRVSGVAEGFGQARGPICVAIEQADTAPAKPENDDCATAKPLIVNANCVSGTNQFAATSTVLPSLNKLARADVWYQFTAPAVLPDEQVQVLSHASFSDIITVYRGGCNALEEIAGNHEGQQLDLSGLTAGETYLIQVAGNFATVEGELCMQVRKQNLNAPANDDCVAAVNIPIGTTCTPGSNTFSGFSGYIPPCVPTISHDIWYKFTAPVTGSVKINSDAAFEQVLAVWKGNCDALTPVKCFENPLRCAGFVTVGELLPGQTYYLQVAALDGPGGTYDGEVCVKIIDGAAMPDFTPIALDASAICIAEGMTKMVVSTSGGVAPFTYFGDVAGTQLPSGMPFLAIVRDAIGCEVMASGLTPECMGGCFMTSSLAVNAPICHNGTGALTVTPDGGIAPYAYLWSNGATTQTATDLVAGDYQVTITDGSGCTTSASYTFAANPAINITLDSLVQPVDGENGALAVSCTGGTGAFTYVWMNNGFMVGNTPYITNLDAGEYQLLVTDASGCTATLNVVLVSVVGTGDLANLTAINLSPNPASESTVLTLRLAKPEPVQVTLTDVQGRTLRTWSLAPAPAQQTVVDVKALPSGMYWVRVVTAGGVVARKLVVE